MADRAQRLYGPVAAARYLGVSRATLHRLVGSGEIAPAAQTPAGFRRFALTELQRYSATRMRVAGPDRSNVDLAETVRRQEALLKLAEQIARMQTAESVCAAAIETVCETLPIRDVASVFLYDTDTASLKRCVGIGLPATVDNTPYPVDGESVPARVFRTGQPIVCEDVLRTAVPLPTLERAQKAGIRAFAAVPIRGQRRVEGVLILLCRHPAAFPPADLGFLEAAADAVARGLESTAQRDRFENVYEAISSMALNLELGASPAVIAQTATDCVAAFDDIQVALVFRLDSRESVLRCIAATAPDTLDPSVVPPVPLTSGHIVEAPEQRAGNLFHHVEDHPLASESAKAIALRFDLDTWYVFPLLGPNGIVGTLSFGSRTAIQMAQGTLRTTAVIARFLAAILMK